MAQSAQMSDEGRRCRDDRARRCCPYGVRRPKPKAMGYGARQTSCPRRHQARGDTRPEETPGPRRHQAAEEAAAAALLSWRPANATPRGGEGGRHGADSPATAAGRLIICHTIILLRSHPRAGPHPPHMHCRLGPLQRRRSPDTLRSLDEGHGLLLQMLLTQQLSHHLTHLLYFS